MLDHLLILAKVRHDIDTMIDGLNAETVVTSLPPGVSKIVVEDLESAKGLITTNALRFMEHQRGDWDVLARVLGDDDDPDPLREYFSTGKGGHPETGDETALLKINPDCDNPVICTDHHCGHCGNQGCGNATPNPGIDLPLMFCTDCESTLALV